MARISPWAAGALGFLASCLTLLALFGFLYLILAASGLFQLLGEWARKTVENEQAYGLGVWRSLWLILLQSLVNIASSLWAARGGFTAFGAIGFLTGWVTRRLVRLDPRLGGVASFLFIFFTLFYVINAGVFFLGSGAESFVDLEAGRSLGQIVVQSPLIALLVGGFFALMVGLLFWELWRLSYTWLLDWCLALSPRLQQALFEASHPSGASRGAMDDWRGYTTRLRQLKRDEEALAQARWRRPRPGQPVAVEPIFVEEEEEVVAPPLPQIQTEAERSLAEDLVRPLTRASLAAVLILPLCVIGIRLMQPHRDEIAARTVKYWAVGIDQVRPEESYSMEIVYRPRDMTFQKLRGEGQVSITLTGPEPSRNQAWALETWDLQQQPLKQETSIADLPPGVYQLTFRMKGEGYADLGYTYSQGGGPEAQLWGLAAGLLLTTAVVAAVVLLVSLVLYLYVTFHRSRMFV